MTPWCKRIVLRGNEFNIAEGLGAEYGGPGYCRCAKRYIPPNAEETCDFGLGLSRFMPNRRVTHQPMPVDTAQTENRPLQTDPHVAYEGATNRNASYDRMEISTVEKERRIALSSKGAGIDPPVAVLSIRCGDGDYRWTSAQNYITVIIGSSRVGKGHLKSPCQLRCL